MKIWLILLLLILYRASCICVPSPQSTRNNWSSNVTTCEVGCRSYAGRAELLPRIVTANMLARYRNTEKVQGTRCKAQGEDIRYKNKKLRSPGAALIGDRNFRQTGVEW